MKALVLLTLLVPGQCPPPLPQPATACYPAPSWKVQQDPRVDAVLGFNTAALDAVRAEKTPPPLAARNLAIMHAAIFDAVNAIERTHRPYRVDVGTRGPTSMGAAAAVAAHRTLVELFPKQRERFDRELEAALGVVADGEARRNGIDLGRYVGEQMLEWRARDGVTEQVAYRPGRTPGEWQPTLPDFKPPLYPQWPKVKCFAMGSSWQFRPEGPPALHTPQYAEAFNEVKALGGVHSTVRTADQTRIAYFWRDDPGTCTPPGHWNMIAQQVAKSRNTSLPENARLFALLNIALADAAIASWDCKFHYQFWRPVTAIRRAAEVNNPRTTPDREWTSLIVAPPFPAYTSGHSTFSGAGATMLARYFGTDRVTFTVGSDEMDGVERTFHSFWCAAEEAGKSRIYGGIHWEFDNADGLAGGRNVADFVYKNFLTPLRQERAALPAEFSTALYRR
ncbi:MAG: vanadium-dependent haloperoxidase [Gemmataceae bacterium]